MEKHDIWDFKNTIISCMSFNQHQLSFCLFVWKGLSTVVRQDVKEDLTEEDLEKTVAFNLTETETIWLLDMPGVCISTESEEASVVNQNNERYQEVS